jgi:hypothetical protein
MDTSNDIGKRCFLCKRETGSFARSHIIARGFYEALPDKTSMVMLASDGEKRRRQDAHYIEKQICHECEKNILKPLDEYAISIYAQKVGGEVVQAGTAGAMTIFKSVDRQRLRAFWASLLWRFSISSLLWEAKDFTIGKEYDERIRLDLLAGGEFNYVNSLVMFLQSINGLMYSMPRRFRMEYKNSQAINAYEVRMPLIGAYVSLDKRPHPVLEYCKWVVDGNRISASLDKEAEGSMLAIANMGEMAEDFKTYMQMYEVHASRRSNWIQSQRQGKKDR